MIINFLIEKKMKTSILRYVPVGIKISAFLLLFVLAISCHFSKTTNGLQSDYDPISQDITIKDSIYPGVKALYVTSEGSIIKILQYYPTGKGLHPTLILLHGFTGMAGNTDVASALCRAGWNVILFRYRGSWGMPGEFKFQSCVEDAVNVANFCKSHSDSMNTDTTRIALFGHSMGGWVALKAAAQLKFVKKVFVLSTWDIYNDLINAKNKGLLDSEYIKEADSYIEIKIASGRTLYNSVFEDSSAFKLTSHMEEMKGKSVFMLDEHPDNIEIAEELKKYAGSLTYEVWKNTDHGFTNTRIAMLRKLITFLDE